MRMRLLLSLVPFLFSAVAVAGEADPFTEGPVSVVTSVKIHDGQFDNYMNYLAREYKPVLEAQKKAGILIDYGVYTTQARNASEPDMYLVTTYANMAAFDGLDDKMEAAAKSVNGQSREQANAAFMDRGKMREIMGSEMIRQLLLK